MSNVTISVADRTLNEGIATLSEGHDTIVQYILAAPCGTF